jgi:hypothetical protein
MYPSSSSLLQTQNVTPYVWAAKMLSAILDFNQNKGTNFQLQSFLINCIRG